MAAAAQARRATARADHDGHLTPSPVRPRSRRVARGRRHALARAGLTRVVVIFVVCLTVLAVGRVALSFAVVQKSLQTEALVHRQRDVSAENARLEEDVAQRSSTVTIRYVAEHELGLVDATNVKYLMAPAVKTPARSGAER